MPDANRPDGLILPHGRLAYPVFLPDATRAFVRSVDSQDLNSTQIQGVVMNTFHLMQQPGSSVIRALGGLHRMAGWQQPILTDSGGFQAYSLIHQNPKLGRMTEDGILYQAEGSDRKVQLTAEKCIQLQMGFDSDLVICLDDCTDASMSEDQQIQSVERTIRWAKACKKEFLKQVEARKLEKEKRPAIFAVVQGGINRSLRKRCADALLEIGFDGFGFGGWPLDSEGRLLNEIVQYTRECIPPEFPLHALGIGHPEHLLTCYRMGYDIFDCALPTRDARRGRLYVTRNKKPLSPETYQGAPSGWFDYLYIQDERYTRLDRPVLPGCDCLTCSRYSLAYLHHLFEVKDPLSLRLATIHNLRYMTTLTGLLQGQPNG